MKFPESAVCPFCFPKDRRPIIAESNMAFAIYDQFPVSLGHTLIIPRRHCVDYFSLSTEEQSDCWNLVSHVKDILEKKFHPDGYNIGVNVSIPAGQTVPHVHIHLIPRFTGDVSNPKGGVRAVIPDKKEY